MTPTPVNKPSARKSLYIFTNILGVKKKTDIPRIGSTKLKRKAIKAGTTLWSKKKIEKETQKPTLADFNRSQSLNSINNNRTLFEVRSSIEVLKIPRSGLGRTLTLPGCSSGLT